MALPSPSPTSAALVTGASSGIGREIARSLARRGHAVLLVARNESRLQELATELAQAHGVRAEVIGCDLTDPAARDALAERVAAIGLDVEILVNSAGFGTYEDFADAPRERILDEVRLDVEALTDLSARWLPAMRERGRGAVVNLSSTSALQALPHNAVYAAAKSYVLLLSEALNAELKDAGVTVTAVLPGPVRTEFQERNDAAFAEKLPRFLWVPPEKVAEYALRATEQGKRSVIPGNALVKAAFAPNRYAPPALAVRVAGRLMK